MRICILTYPLNNNFGNLLQAWALMTHLSKKGNAVDVVYRKNRQSPFAYQLDKLKYHIRKLIGLNAFLNKSPQQEKSYSANTFRFIDETIKAKALYSSTRLHDVLGVYDLIVLGSDQIWRPRFLNNLYKDYFLAGYRKPESQQVVTYAASLGTDKWEFSEEQESIVGKSIINFDKVSVREKSSVELLKSKLGVDSCVNIDPTLLLDSDDYDTLLDSDDYDRICDCDMFCYILDMTSEMRQNIEDFARHNNLMVKFINDYSHTENGNIYPDVRTWLSGIKNSRYVLTNSFHGSAFSIIYGRPFLVMENEMRGNTRISSLLKQFGISCNLITINDLVTRTEMPCFDFSKINEIRKKLKGEAEEYLSL